MSESDKSLEDFFAKKSKKKGGKGKPKKKFTTSDEIAKKLVEQDTTSSTAGSAWKGQKSQVSSSVPTQVTSQKAKEPGKDGNEGKEEQDPEEDINYRFKDDEEWTDFHDDSKKDYTGLKIQALQVTDEQPEGEEEEEELDENGEPIKNRDKGASGPWNKKESNPTPPPVVAAPAPVPEPEPPKEEPKPAPTTGGKYVPPNRRGGAPAPSGPGPMAAALKTGRKGVLPQINNEFEFPTLAASSDLAKHSNKAEDATFSTVTRGGQAVDGASSKPGGDLVLENRYAALGN